MEDNEPIYDPITADLGRGAAQMSILPDKKRGMQIEAVD
jgi:hypothetical protein